MLGESCDCEKNILMTWTRQKNVLTYAQSKYQRKQGLASYYTQLCQLTHLSSCTIIRPNVLLVHKTMVSLHGLFYLSPFVGSIEYFWQVTSGWLSIHICVIWSNVQAHNIQANLMLHAFDRKYKKSVFFSQFVTQHSVQQEKLLSIKSENRICHCCLTAWKIRVSA